MTGALAVSNLFGVILLIGGLILEPLAFVGRGVGRVELRPGVDHSSAGFALDRPGLREDPVDVVEVDDEPLEYGTGVDEAPSIPAFLRVSNRAFSANVFGGAGPASAP